ncbi:MAG TPA: rod shape-determining protein MreD [Bacteroidetes bacterium]|nr:rod shape-determining protein MreD [Bacteroidota bacterium]
MQILILGLVYILVLLAQLTFANLLSVYSIKPDFVLIFVIYISFRFGRLWGGVGGFAAGIIEDSFITVLFGLNALCKTFVGFLVSVFPWRITGRATPDAALLLFLAALVHDFLFNVIYSLGSGTGLFFIFFRFALPGALYTLLFGSIFHAIFPGFLKFRYEHI